MGEVYWTVRTPTQEAFEKARAKRAIIEGLFQAFFWWTFP